MTTICVCQVKDNLKQLLAEDSDGEEIIITQENRPVGIIQPIKAFTPIQPKPQVKEQAFVKIG